ncbi:MAG: SBBP repeat-containing protein [Ignavibacteria bacterium]
MRHFFTHIRGKYFGLYRVFYFSLLVLCSVVGFHANAKEKIPNTDSYQLLTKLNVEFIENKGQVIDQNGTLRPDVLYYASVPDGLVFVTKHGVSFEFHRLTTKGTPPDPKQSPSKENDFQWTKDVYRIDMVCNNSNSSPRVIGEKESEDYINFYLAHCTDGITEVKKYERILIKDIYQNIDFVLYRNDKGKLQYDFIVHPGGNPKDISFTFNGADSISLTAENDLQVHTPFGILLQGKPYTYQAEKIPSSFAINDNTVSFIIGEYDPTSILTIDPPTRIWGTYYGDTGSDALTSVTTDPSNNVYVSGFTTSSTWIATSGAHQTSYDGTRDAMLVKFTSSSGRLWATYYGGALTDLSYGVIASSSSVYIAGGTESTTAIATTGAHQTSLSGSRDGMLVKFSSSGVRQWGTYYGGSNYDGLDDITLDASENVYVVGLTNSTTGIATSGSHQSSIGGTSDGLIAKFNTNGVRQWGSYYGGLLDDHAVDIVSDASNNVYICGETSSSTSIATTGAHQTTNAGGIDAFAVKFNTNGARQWGTYYGGSSDDEANNIARDASANIYVVGETNSVSGIATTGAHQTSFGSGTDAFIVKLNTNGVRQWGSFYAGDGDDIGIGVVCDPSGNVFFGGYTSSTNNIASSNGYQTTFAGVEDEFLVKFNSSGVRQWGTYYGGSNDDGSVNLAIDGSGFIYNAGTSLSTSQIAFQGFWDFHSGDNDGYVVKWQDGSGGGTTNSISCSAPKTSYCQGETFTLSYSITGTFNSGNAFQAQISDQFGSFTSPIVIGSVNSVNSGTITCVIPFSISTGTAYRIRVVSSNPNVIGSNNGLNITINALPIPVINGNTSVCLGATNVQYSVSPVSGHSYQWYQPIRGTIVSGTTSSTVSINWNIATGTEQLKMRQTNNTTGCFKDTILNITIGSSPTPVIFGNTSVCLGATNVQYSVSPVSGHSYQWYQPIRGTIVSGATSSTVIINWTGATGTEQLKMRQTNNTTGCFKDTVINVTINSAPNPSIIGKSIVCEGDRLQLYQVQSVSNHSYQWLPLNKGTYVGSTSSSAVSINWNNNASGYENITVRQTNNLTGCFKDTSFSVYISPKPQPLITGSNIVCVGSTADYSVANRSNHSYQWFYPKNGTITSSIYGNTAKINWTIKGTDTLKIRQTDNASGCFQDTMMIITIQDAPTAIVSGTRVSCLNSAIEIYTVQSVPGYSYSWYGIDKGTVISGSTGNSVRILWDKSIGYDSMFVLVTDKSSGCSTIGGYQVEVVEAPRVEIFGPNSACENQQNLVFKTVKRSGSTYTWSALSQNISINGNYTLDSVIINAKNAGIAFLKLTEMNIQGCIRDTTIAILVENGLKPEITAFGGVNYLCKGDSRGLECKMSADSYQWKREGVNIPGAIDRIYLAFEGGRYSVSTKSGDCSGESDNITLTEMPLPKPIITGPLKVNKNQKSIAYQVGSQVNSTYKWEAFGNATITSNPNNSVIVVDFFGSGNAYIKVTETDRNTCTKDTMITVVIEGVSSLMGETHNQQSIIVYPNPISGEHDLSVDLPHTFGMFQDLHVYNSLGIKQESNAIAEIHSSGSMIKVNVSSLVNGVYTMAIQTNKGKHTIQFIIAH